jgi:hypothetical protein
MADRVSLSMVVLLGGKNDWVLVLAAWNATHEEEEALL